MYLTFIYQTVVEIGVGVVCPTFTSTLKDEPVVALLLMTTLAWFVPEASLISFIAE